MSRAFIAEYFDYAKKHGNDPAVGFLQDKKTNWIPHWLLRSKAKHFGLGLLNLNAPDQGYFYLFPHFHPEWLYSLIAAQSLGLTTVTVPPHLGILELERLAEKFPPCFVYGDRLLAESQWKIFKKEKLFRSFILGGSTQGEADEFVSSFRKIHNQGVMAESKHFQSYRERRESLPENLLLSPIQVDASHKIAERALRSNQLEEKFQTLNKHLHDKKAVHLFAEVDLSRSTDQIVALYWPLMTGKRVLIGQGSDHWLNLSPSPRPHIAFLSPIGVAGLAGALSLGKAPLLKKSLSFWTRQRAKRKLGGNLQEIWSTGPLGEEAQSLFQKLGLRLWTVEV